MAQSLSLLGFNKMQDTKHSIFTELLKNTDYIHKSFLAAHQLLDQRARQEFEGLPITIISILLAGCLKGKETGKCTSSHPSLHIMEETDSREQRQRFHFSQEHTTIQVTICHYALHSYNCHLKQKPTNQTTFRSFPSTHCNSGNVLRSNALTTKTKQTKKLFLLK